MATKPIATIPADLRERTDLTLEDVSRIVHLRKQREKFTERAERLEKDAKQARTDAAGTVAEENEILGVEETAPAESAS